MDFINTALKSIEPLWPTGLTLLVVIFVVVILRSLFRTHRIAASENKFKYQMFTLIIVLIGILISILVLPINESTRGQLLSLLGLVISATIALSSTTLLGNILAGFMLRAIRNFRPGDYVRVEQYFGRITERGLFHIEIQNEDSDLTTLPNLFFVTHPVKVIRESGTIITSDISLGYDLSRKTIENALITAAENAGLKEPFVYVMDLGDFSITYRVSGLLNDVKHLLSAKSNLRKCILDHLQKQKIEIVSPTFMNTRAIPVNKAIRPDDADIPDGTIEQNSSAPEEIVFEKADEAQSLDKLKETYANLEDEITKMKAKLKKSETDNESNNLRYSLDELKKRKQQISEFIQELEEDEKK